MPLTAADVRNKTFTISRLRPGYDENEVDAFLDEIELELDRLVRENEELRARLAETVQGRWVAPVLQTRPAREPEGGGAAPEAHVEESAAPPASRTRELFEPPGTGHLTGRPSLPAQVGWRTGISARVADDPPRRPVLGRAVPAESTETYDGGEVRVIAFDESERLLFDHGGDGQILNWTTALSPSAAGVLALELAGTDAVEEACLCVSGETGDINTRLIAPFIYANPIGFDKSCDFLRIDFGGKSIAYQRLSRDNGPAVGFLGIAADRLDLPLVASLIVQTGTRQVVGAALNLRGYRLLDHLDRLLATDLPTHEEGVPDGRS